MRNFDETMNEIRSRSKTRIKKRRKYIATASSAFVVCIALAGTLLIPNSAQTAVHATEVTNTEQMYIGTTTVFYDSGDILAIAEGGEEILQYIGTLKESYAEIQTTIGTKTAGLEATTQTTTYRFEITNHLGMLRRFRLTDGVLVDEDREKIYILDSNQRLHLLRLLHIEK